MKFEDALTAMRKGLHVRRTGSKNRSSYTAINEEKTALVNHVVVAEHDVVYTPTLEDLLAEDWEEVE